MTMSAVDDWMEIPAHSASFTFAANVTGGKPSAKIRMRVASISSGTPSITPHIAVAYHG